MRKWDIRVKPFKPVIEFKVDTNFATTADIWVGDDSLLMATGHRGFNFEGAEVKLWDLRNFGTESVLFKFDKHEFSPESVRFLRDAGPKPLIVSASKDASLCVIDEKGELLSREKHLDSFACMEVLGSAPWDNNIKIIVAADIKQKILMYTYNTQTQELRPYNQ